MPARMTVSAAIYDNHTAELVDAVLPQIREALRLGEAHPDADALMAEAADAIRGAFRDSGIGHEAADWVFSVLVGVAEVEARERDDNTHPPSRQDPPR